MQHTQIDNIITTTLDHGDLAEAVLIWRPKARIDGCHLFSVQNALFAEMATAMSLNGGTPFNFQNNSSWGRKQYSGFPIANWKHDPFSDTPCNCSQDFQDLQHGWK